VPAGFVSLRDDQVDSGRRLPAGVFHLADDAVSQQQVTSELDVLRGDASGRLASAESLVAPG